VVDGDLSDPCWNEALELFPFSTLGGGGSLGMLQTKVKVAWGAGGFYVGYLCEQPDMELAERRGDQLEVFFMPLYANQPLHVNHATSLLALAHQKPEEFHYQQAWGRMGGKGGLYFRQDTGVKSAGKVGPDWWTWEAFIPFKDLWVRGMPPPDSSVRYWRIGFSRWSSFHGEIGWYGAMVSSLNHQMNHCPVFRLEGVAAAPAIRLTQPTNGKTPGEFLVALKHLGDKEASYRVRVLRRNEPFDADITEAQAENGKVELVNLKTGEEVTFTYHVPCQGWRNQYRVEVWEGSGKALIYRGLWYSLGEPLTHGWDSARPQLGILPEPKRIKLGRGAFLLSGEIPVVLSSDSESDRLAAGFLTKPIGYLSEPWPSFRTIPTLASDASEDSSVVLGRLDTPRVRNLMRRQGLDVPPGNLSSQGYILVVDRKFILVAGQGDAGTFYGVQTLRQLVMQHRKALPAVSVVDWPDLNWRGAWHTFRVTPENIDLACLFKLNSGGPSLADKKKYHFQPLIFSAHTWFGHTGGSLVPPEERETVGGEAVICPAANAREGLVANLDDSIRKTGIDSTETDYVFVGGDEAPFGLDTACQKMIDERGAGWTVAHHFRDNMHAACKARGKTMCCWADALLGFEDSLNYMPKDFHPMHWIYYPSLYFGGCDLLGKHRLPFVVAPMTRGENSFRFPQVRSRELNIATLCRHAAHAGGKGVWLTTWDGGIDDDLLWYSYLLAAEYGWSSGPDLPAFRRKFGRLFYGSEHGADWLFDLERFTALYLTPGTFQPPVTLKTDRDSLRAIRSQIGQVVSRDWYTKAKLETLLKTVAEVEQAISSPASAGPGASPLP
jgi:hypothetical protein